ncbi:MAG: NAD(P)H-quinone oxidoreductase [Propylenella sp.]
MAVPATMRAIGISAPGGPEVLVVQERPVPALRPGEILVAVAAAGVNRPDVMQRKGQYPPPPGASDVPGLEISGLVAKCGEGARRFKEGDEVIALVPGGGYAEFCTVHESNALPLPKPLTLVEGAGIPETTFTVWHNVFQRGGLRRGEWLLVHGGSSGIGTTAIQLAKAFGAFVAATAGSDTKCDAIRKLGAESAINYKTADFVEAVKQATNGRGADVILDMVGGDYLMKNLEAVADDGRIVMISTLHGSKTEIDLRRIMLKRATLTGSALRPRPIAFKAELARAIEETVWPIMKEGRFKPVIDSTYPFVSVVDAHRRIDGGEHVGKIILTMSE